MSHIEVHEDEDNASENGSPTFLPTRHLPSLRPLPSSEVLHTCLDRLAHAIGLGQERVIRIPFEDQDLRNAEGSISTFSSDCDDDELTASASSDAIESRFAQTWLTRVISSFSPDSSSPKLQERAGEILAALCGNPASAPERTRFLFSTSDSRSGSDADQTLKVLVQDSAITADALGNRTWGSAPLLAGRFVSLYSSLSQGKEGMTSQSLPTKILELGAGTGLVGLALAVLARGQLQQRLGLDLTDYHPHVLANLQTNVELNFGKCTTGERDVGEQEDAIEEEQRVQVRVSHLDWQQVHDSQQRQADSPHERKYTSTAQTLPSSASSIDAGTSQEAGVLQDHRSFQTGPTWPSLSCSSGPQYDLLIACDCVYDPLHPLWIRSVAQVHLCRHSQARLWLISPLRRTHSREVEAIYEAFPRELPQGRGVHSAQQQHNRSKEEPVQLRIVWEHDQVGYDNFGPKGGSGGFAGTGAARTSRGVRTVYRTWEIRWCAT